MLRNERSINHKNPNVAQIRASRIGVTYLPISKVKLNLRNPRHHSPRQIRQIARSIEAFGFNVPVLIDSRREVIAGHGRVLACQLLSRTEVPTISLEHLSEAQAKAFVIADNKLTLNAEWDDRLLGEQLKELSVLDLDFSLEATGFEMGEIDLRIEGLDSQPPADEADDLSSLATGPCITVSGDLWLLGRNRVYCGSALEKDAYNALLDGEQAEMVFTDPPYNVPIAGNVSGLGTVKHRDFEMASGEMSEEEFTEFLERAFLLHARQSVKGSLHFVCMDWRHMGELLAAARRSRLELKNLCIWAKDNGGMGSLYRSQHELVFVLKNGKAQHRNNVMLGIHGRNRSNLWRYPCATSFSRSSDEGNLLASHPTVKPVAMVADAIMDASARGDVVLDGFLGSGTTVIAAERTGRRCFGLELDPSYVDTVVRRWQAFTRGDALHAASGKSFAQLEHEVERKRRCKRKSQTATR